MGSKHTISQISDASPMGFSEAQVIFVIGGPGVGKSTQCSRLARETDVVHFSVGDLLRMVPPSPLRDLIDSKMRRGELVPDDVILPSLQNQINAKMREGKPWFLIDGFPRSLGQAVMFEEKTCKSIATLHFDCRPEIMTQRVAQRAESSGRIDDNPSTLQLRQEGFSVVNTPIMDYYRSSGRLVEINCDRPLDEIYGDFKTVVENLFKSAGPRAEGD